MPSERRLWKIVFDNFLKSLQPKLKEKPIGCDAQGNQYFELEADPRGGRRLPRRWFVPVNEETGVPTPEWSQWLRGRRDNPPTVEEIALNEAIGKMKKLNAEDIAQKFRLPGSSADNETDHQPNSKGFPDLSEHFERQPGNIKSKMK